MFKRFWWVFLVMAVAMPVLGLMISSVVTYVMPKKYESTATLGFGSDRLASHPATEAFDRTVEDHLEAMGSESVLQRLADNLQLSNRWGCGRELVVGQLRALIRTERIRNTDLVTVRVRHTNKEEAREIIAELVAVYAEELRSLPSGGAARELPGRSGEWIELPIPLFVYEAPAIAKVPISPNVRLNLLIGILGGFVLSPFLSLPLIWLLDVSVRKKAALPA